MNNTENEEFEGIYTTPALEYDIRLMLFLPLVAALPLTSLSGQVDGVTGLNLEEVLATTVSLRNTHTESVLRKPVNSNGEFVFPIEDGEYILSLDSGFLDSRTNYLVRSENAVIEVFSLPENSALVAQGRALPLPLTVYTNRVELVPKRPHFEIKKYLFTPTVLLASLMLVFILAIPLILRNLDPEIIEEMRKQNGPASEFDLAERIADFRTQKKKKE